MLSYQADAATWLDPNLKFKTIETAHFYIVYPEQLKNTAERMTRIAEEVYQDVDETLKARPAMKPYVVLLDTTDYANGMTTVIPNPLIILYVTDGGSNLRPIAYESWLRYVFLHEYAHLVHLDTISGGARAMNLLFGRIIFPNAIQPTFMIEGLATYFETWHGTGGGRGVDARWEAMMRMDVLEDKIKSLDQAAVRISEWPGGHLPYLYGVEFMEYLCMKYGEDKLARVNHEYGDYLLYYDGIDGMFREVYGKSLPDLWKDWLAYIKDKYQKQKVEVEKAGETKPRLLTASGYYNLKPAWSPDSKYIYFSQNNADNYPNLRRYSLSSRREEKVFDGYVFDDNLSFSGINIYLAKGDTYKNYYAFKDLYQFNTSSGSLKRLTEGVRASDPTASPDGKTIVYVRNHDGQRTLWKMDANGGNHQMIGSAILGVQYYAPRFSPDGKYLAVAKWSEGGTQEVYLLDSNTWSEKKKISLGMPANPSFSPDGQYLIFDSDYSGIVNLYACHLVSGQIYQITNVIGAAMMPDVSPDGKYIAYVSYSARGHDIALMKLDPKEWKPLEQIVKVDVPIFIKRIKEIKPTTTAELTGILTNGSEKQPEKFELKRYDYNPFWSLMPKMWLPTAYIYENGTVTHVATYGMDILSQHFFELQAGYDSISHRESYMFQYVNNQFAPQFNLHLHDQPVGYYSSSISDYLWERRRGGEVDMTLIDNRVLHEYDRQALTLGYVFENLTNVSSLGAFPASWNTGNLRGASLTYQYTNTRSYSRSISPEDGISLMLRYTSYFKALGSDYAYEVYNGSFGTYFPLARHSVIALKTSAQGIRGDQIGQSGFTWNYLSLHGYPADLMPGNKQISGSLEFRFPVSYMETGWGYGVNFFDRLSGKVYLELGNATFGSVTDMYLNKSLGVEGTLNTINLFGMVPFNIILGYAKGLDTGGEQGIYFNFSL